MRCTDQSGCLYVVEMQMVDQKDYAPRAQYYSSIAKEKELTDAFNVLAQSNWSKPELESYDRYLDNIRSQINQIDTAEAKGEAKGLAKGLEKGKIQIAVRLLKKGTDINIIADLTDLSIEKIKNLK